MDTAYAHSSLHPHVHPHPEHSLALDLGLGGLFILALVVIGLVILRRRQTRQKAFPSIKQSE